MIKLLISVAILFTGIGTGQILKYSCQAEHQKVERISMHLNQLQQIALLGINPFATACAFWGITAINRRYLVLPFLGLFALTSGGAAGLAISRLLKHTTKQRGALFVSSSFTNMGNFGGLICFVFFGEKSYAFVLLYKLFEELFYYMIGYPIAKHFGTNTESERNTSGSSAKRRIRFKRAAHFARDPYIAAYGMAIIIGLLLRFSGYSRPDFLGGIIALLIPASSLFLAVSTGFRMYFTAIRSYLKECLSVASIKFLVVPVLINAACMLSGIQNSEDDLPYRVAIVLSAMPPAFNSLIPPKLYNLDTDLANSCWIFCTAALPIVITALAIIIG